MIHNESRFYFVISTDINFAFINSNAGDLQFGPDGFLYITSGDGGWFGDPENRSQDLTSMLGKLLRIDVDQTSNGKNYVVPSDNPFVSTSDAIPEIWAFGLRNPWKISFDQSNGDLFIADVGQNLWEEINYQPNDSTGGENYGWRLMEGYHCYNPETDCEVGTSARLTYPVMEYGHIDGACSVTGGYMYRGSRKKLLGSYYFGDYCNGSIWAGKMQNGSWTYDLVKESSGLYISSFGEDVDGNHYVADIIGGSIYKLDVCFDDKTFYYNNKTNKTCKWIRKNRRRTERLCKKSGVYKNCKATCRNPTC